MAIGPRHNLHQSGDRLLVMRYGMHVATIRSMELLIERRILHP